MKTDLHYWVDRQGVSIAGDQLFVVRRSYVNERGVVCEDVAPHRWVRERFAERALAVYQALPLSLFDSLPSTLVQSVYSELFGADMCDPDPMEAATAEEVALAENRAGRLADMHQLIVGR